MYNPVHEEQFFAGDTAENFAIFPVVHQQVIVGMRPERLVDARRPQGELERAACPRSEAPSSLGSSWCRRLHMTTVLLRSS